MASAGRAESGAFNYRQNRLHAEEIALESLAVRFGTPLYVYSRHAIERAYADFAQALSGTPHLVCYAVKANANLALLHLLARLGAGFDIVSVGELERVLRAGGDAQKIVFSGVGKREDELRRALEVGIRCFNVESAAELERLDAIAQEMGKPAPVALRINPGVQSNTHPHINTGHAGAKFGVDIETAEALGKRALNLPGIRLIGLACHIGSQLTEVAPYAEAARGIVALADRLAGASARLEHLDFGGGFGIRYRDEQVPAIADFIAAARTALGARALQILMEPGRALVGAAGLLLTRIEYVKPAPHARLLIVDAGMTELIRPPLYDAWHEVREVTPRPMIEQTVCEVAGPVCESADVLARERRLAARAGDLLAIMDCGAYGASMGNTYNSRTRPAEVLVSGNHADLIRRRETVAELMNLDILPE